MKIQVLSFLFLFFSQLIFPRTNSTISGLVHDVNKLPVPYANVILISSADSSVFKAGLTDESGKYNFADIENGSYRMLVAQLGYTKYYSELLIVNDNSQIVSVNDISLTASEVILKETTVSALKPLIEHKIDRTIINVENSIVNAGANVLEILKRSPGVTIDYEGNIFLNGKQGILIMIDGKPTYLSQKDLYEMFRNLSSDQLSTIEIITNPSAKYDAAGTTGIINIRLRKKVSTGFNGRAQISYGQGVYPDFGTGFSLNYGSEKINLYSGYDYMNGWYYEDINLSRKFIEDNYSSTFKQYSFNKGQFVNHTFRGGADYFINDKNTLGIVLRGNQYVNHERNTSSTDIYNLEQTPDSGYVTYNQNESKWSNFSGTVNYSYKIDTAGKELSLDADYAHYDNSNDFLFTTDHYFYGNDFTYSEKAFNDQPAIIDIQSLKADYTHPWKKNMKFETGAKTSYVVTDSDVKYYNNISGIDVIDSTKTNHFKYKENINAAYINWSGEFGKTGVQAGLRTEQTISEGNQYAYNSNFERDYIQFFPSVFFSHKFTDKHQAKTSYSRRIDRPAYQQLNPFKYFIDPYNYMEGNPMLMPQLTNSFELSYTYLQLYTVAFNLSHTANAMTQITKQIDSTHTTYVTTENLDSYDNYGINLSIPIDVTEWLQSTNSFNLYNNHYQGKSSVGMVDNDLTSYSFNSTNSFTLPKGITAELIFWYNSETVWGTWLVQPTYSVSGGISKMFLKERMQFRINFNDIFHTDIMHSQIKYENIDADFERIYDSQFLRFHLSYKFGKQMQKRGKRSGTTEEQDRVRQGH